MVLLADLGRRDERGGRLTAPAAAEAAALKAAAEAGLLSRTLDAALGLLRALDPTDATAPEVPSAVRPLLGFRRLQKTARVTLALAINADPALRSYLAERLKPAQAEGPALVWLTAERGWPDYLLRYAAEESDVTVDVKKLERQIEGAERAAQRLRDENAELAAEAARLRERADAARAEAKTAIRDRDSLRRNAKQLEDEIVELRAALSKAETAAVKRGEERRRLRDRIRELEEQSGRASTSREAQRLSRAVLGALRAATADAEALDRGLSETPARTSRPAGSSGATRPLGRRPARLPGGVVEDSVAAAEHLVSRPSAVLFVDGYNATLATWPELALDMQRDRLVLLLETVAARLPSLSIHVVFDGVEVGAAPRRRRTPAVQVRFTPADVEADDVILELVEQLGADMVPIVASNDRRVRDGARDRGANVISVQQLLALGR